MNKKDSYVLVIGKLLEGIEVQLINELGYKTIVMGTKLNLTQALEADLPIELNLNCDTTVLNKVQELSEKYHIVAVYTLNEYRVPLCAKVRETLGIIYGIPYEAAMNCRSKKRTREVLSAMGDRAVQYHIVNCWEKASEVIEKMLFPVVVKPCNDAGSNMVFCCRKKSEVEKAVSQILQTSKNTVGQKLEHEVLIEEFLDGPEFSVESYTKQGKTNIIAITAKHILSPFNPIEVGHTVPAMLDEREKQDIESLVKEAVTLLGINDTVTHIEVKLTSNGARIVEVNARPGGDKIPALVEATTGYNLHQISLLLALGMTIEEKGYCPCRPKKADIRFLVANGNGKVTFDHLCELSKISSIQKVNMQVNEGDQVVKTTSNYNRLGWLMAYDETDEVLKQLVNRVKVEQIKCCCQ